MKEEIIQLIKEYKYKHQQDFMGQGRQQMSSAPYDRYGKFQKEQSEIDDILEIIKNNIQEIGHRRENNVKEQSSNVVIS